MVVEAGQVMPGDGEVVDGVATVDESAITGESAPVIRESGGDRSAVTGGTTVLSDRIVVRITTKPGESFIDRMIALVEGAQRQKTPNEIALTILLTTLTIVFLVTVMAIQPLASYSGHGQPVVVLVALLVCLIPTTIGALLSAIGIAGMDRLVQRNVLAMSGRAVEAAGDVSTLLLDKTGTITFGNRRATELLTAGRRGTHDLPDAAYLSSLADSTPEGKSIVDLATTEYAVNGGRSAEVLRPRRGAVRRVQRHDPDVRRRPARRHPDPQGRHLRGAALGGGVRRHPAEPGAGARRRHQQLRVARRSWWPARTARRRLGPWGSSTSRTWSSPACANASMSCAPWGFAPS